LFIIEGDNVNTVKKYGFKTVLPCPQGEWVIANGTKIGVENKGGIRGYDAISPH
jgi:hypothetical protein